MQTTTIEPGIYTMPMADYRAVDGVSKSDLDLIARSPAHYQQEKATPSVPTAAMLFGTALHAAVLEPAVFDQQYVVAPNVDRRTKAGKEAWEEFEASLNGRSLVDGKDLATINAMAAAIASHPTASSLLSGGVAEQSCFWINSGTRELCKCRPDYIREDGIIVDLKTTTDASLDPFMRSAYTYRYHVQAAMYIAGVRMTTGKATAFVIIAIEKTPPYAIACYMADSNMLEAGHKEFVRNLRTYAECRQANQWPGYPQSIQSLSVPVWAL
jgi:hypothetical protein